MIMYEGACSKLQTPFSSVIIVDFEQIIVCWEVSDMRFPLLIMNGYQRLFQCISD